ncbi:ATP-dependent RNA helicase RhlB [Streptomyces griseus subsp. griseus]
MNLRLATVVGGMSITKQSATLRRGAEVLVATPGRLKDLIERGDCRLDEVSITVLDEADQMADMGFMPQVVALLKQVEADGQRMLFSATLDKNIDRLVKMFLTDPVVHSVDPSAGAVTTMEHHVLHVLDETDKKAVATKIAAREGRVIMFVDTKRAADRFAKRLLASGVRRQPCTADGRSRSATGPRSVQERAGHRARRDERRGPASASTTWSSTGAVRVDDLPDQGEFGRGGGAGVRDVVRDRQREARRFRTRSTVTPVGRDQAHRTVGRRGTRSPRDR